MNILSAFGVPLIRNAFLALVFAGGTLSLLGIVIVNMNLTGLRFTFMHVGMLGAAIGLSLQFPVTTSAFALIMVVAGLMGIISETTSLSVNSLSGYFMTGSLACAFIILSVSGVPAMEVFGIFAGNILILRTVDLWVVVIMGVGVVAFLGVWYYEVQMLLLDSQAAEVLGVPVRPLRLTMHLLLGAAVAVALRLVGALLVDAILLLPAMAALPLARSLKQALFLTALFGIVASAGGFLSALALDLPVGATVALWGTALLLVSMLIKRRTK